MFNIELIRQDIKYVKEKLSARNFNTSLIDSIYDLDVQNRELKTKIQNLSSEKNKLSKEIGILFQQKEAAKAQELQEQVKHINEQIEFLSNNQNLIQNQLNNELMIIPNILSNDVPIGEDETFNKPIKYVGEPRKMDFDYLPHWELASKLNILNLEKAAKLAGSRFSLYIGDGAKLYRALQQFTLDHNVANGYKEVLPPVIVLDECLYGTGQLPKFKEDVYGLKNDGIEHYLSPTAEVQLVNIYRDEIVSDLPIRLTANTPCFRSEAGSAGRDTKGVLRLHQFYKSELVTICAAEESENEHEKITRTAELVLEKLNLPYRRLLLCSGDTGFGSSKTFDLEVWLPCYQEYKEISSCSNCIDFQARRASIRTKDENGNNVLVHTLNGSSLAIDRLWVAVVENYQQADGSILIPEALVPYMNGQKVIK